MTIRQYKSSTDFDKALELDITETITDRNTTFIYKGFKDINQAQRFATWWEDLWWGYFGQAIANTSADTGEAIVLCSRYNSCD